MLAELSRLHHINEHDLLVTVSIGISIYPDDGHDPETLVKNADMAMYDAKDSGRNNYQFFTPEMNRRSVQRQTIESALRLALERAEFALYYQPKINLQTKGIVGAEALIRWRHAERGLLYPAQFIPIAEECGLIMSIDRWVLREGCRQIRAWEEMGRRPVPVSFNISAAEFRDKKFLEYVRVMLNEIGLDPGYLELELTESVLMQNAEAAAVVLKALKSIGVRLAIDDFGTGYSSLSYLSHFPIDVLKIDQSFIHEINTHQKNATIINAVIGMCDGLRCQAVAEGVETQEQANFLRNSGCLVTQGYYFGRPMVPEEFFKLLSPQ
jgi:EAL domain-containing protein (putative c-di-GMP-specific phosphodiesterase class I)